MERMEQKKEAYWKGILQLCVKVHIKAAFCAKPLVFCKQAGKKYFNK